MQNILLAEVLKYLFLARLRNCLCYPHLVRGSVLAAYYSNGSYIFSNAFSLVIMAMISLY